MLVESVIIYIYIDTIKGVMFIKYIGMKSEFKTINDLLLPRTGDSDMQINLVLVPNGCKEERRITGRIKYSL